VKTMTSLFNEVAIVTGSSGIGYAERRFHDIIAAVWRVRRVAWQRPAQPGPAVPALTHRPGL